jgi:hypothetical protein
VTASEPHARRADNASATPSLCHTGLGYEYFRDRADGADDTVYVHQLTACLDYDPHVVFDSETDVHHVNHVPWDNRPANLEPRNWLEHRVEHLDNP